VAWFAGFLPHDEPRLAFACLYEGRPGEKVSGARNGCPMVPAFFEPLKDEIKELIAPPPKAVVIVDPEAAEQGDAPKAIPVDPGEVGTGLDDERPEGLLRPQPPEPPPAVPEGGPAVEDVFDPAAPDDSGSPAEEMAEPVPRALPVRPEELGE
jgi:penicillin-binding protein 2